MGQFYKQTFYFDKSRKRAITIEYNKGFKEVFIAEDGEDIYEHKKPKELLKGLFIKTKKGENLFIQLYRDPARWEVKIGSRFLVNSYNSALDSLKSISNLFYFIFGVSLFFFLINLAQAIDTVPEGQLSFIIFLTPYTILYVSTIILFFLCALLLRKGFTLWYFIGTVFYSLDTLYIILIDASNISSNVFLIIGLVVRIVFVYKLIKAYKHVVSLRRHQKDIEKKVDDGILDLE